MGIPLNSSVGASFDVGDDSGGPVLTNGLPSQLANALFRSWQGKKQTNCTITSTLVGDGALACGAGLMKTVLPGQKVQMCTGGSTAANETVIVSRNYVINATATSIPLENPVVNAGSTTARWDIFDPNGPHDQYWSPDDIQPIVVGVYDPNAKQFAVWRAATLDGLPTQNAPVVSSGLYNGGSLDRQRGNLDNVSLINAVGATTTQTSPDQTNYNHRGVLVFFNMATVGTGSVTITIQGKDPVSNQYYTILAGVAVITNIFTVYRVYPGLTAVANSVVSDILPRTWRVLATANNANATTYTIGYALIL